MTKNQLDLLANRICISASLVALHAVFLQQSPIVDDEIELVIDANIVDLRQACEVLISAVETVKIEHHQPQTMELETDLVKAIKTAKVRGWI